MMILLMFGIVLYDSYTHILPFHYVLFAVAGVLAGRIYRITNKVHFNKEEVKIKIEIGISALVIMIITMFIRYFGGKWLLITLEIVWISDALYLFFIGLHLEKVIATRKNIDDLLYTYLMKTKSSS